MPEPVTLASLRRAAPFLSVAAVARALGVSSQTLHTRLRRGAPEVSADESARITAVLRAAGVVIGATG